MSHRSRFGQIGMKVQAAEGSAESLATGDYTFAAADIEVTYDVKRAERVNEKATYSPLASVPTARSIGIRGVMELVGGAAGTEPIVGRLLRAMCFTYTAAKMITIGTVVNGPFKTGHRIGDNATEGSATKTGLVLHVEDQGAGAFKLWYLPGVGTLASSDTLYAYPATGLQPSADITANPVSKGHVYTPLDPNGATESAGLTIDRRKGAEAHRAIDFRADGGLAFEVGQFAKLNFDGKGVPNLDLTDAANPEPLQPSPAFVASVAALPEPDPCRGMFLEVGAAAFVITKAEITFGAAVTERGSISGETLSSGMVAPRHTDRKIQIKIDPEYVRGSGSGDFQSKIFTTVTTDFIVNIGSTAGANGLWKVYCPTCQTSEHANGDRDGLLTDDVTLDAIATAPGGEAYIANLWG